MKKTEKIVLTGVLMAVVFILQYFTSPIKVGVFTVATVLIPIVIGAALCGVGSGALLGFTFGVAVLASGDAGVFIAVNPFGSVVTVLAKGTLAGFTAGIAYKLLEKRSKTAAVYIAAIICPIVNTGVFVLGCYAFFAPTIEQWFGATATSGIFTGLVGVSFFGELGVNIIFAPAIAKLIHVGFKTFRKKIA